MPALPIQLLRGGLYLWLANHTRPDYHVHLPHQLSIATLVEHIIIFHKKHGSRVCTDRPCLRHTAVENASASVALRVRHANSLIPGGPHSVIVNNHSSYLSYTPLINLIRRLHMDQPPPVFRGSEFSTWDEAPTVSLHPLTPSDPTRPRVLSSGRAAITRHTRSCRSCKGRLWKQKSSLAYSPPQLVDLKRPCSRRQRRSL
jgi:hypothetical protein